MKKYLIIIGAAIVLAACGVKKENEKNVVAVTEARPEVVEEVFIEPEPELPTERPIYQETETILTDLIHTRLEVNFDWTKSRMNGIATITAKPHFYTSNKLILDAKGMIINSVSMDGAALKHVYKDDFLTINLGKEYTRNDDYTVTIDYVACPDERVTGGSSAISSDKGLYFINPTGEDPDKMPQIWTQGETEASSVWFPTIDAPNSKTTQEIFITVDEKYKTLSNGKLISSKKAGKGKRVDHWKQELPHAPYLFMMGIGEFKVVKDTYTRPDGSVMEVNYYVEPEWEQYARDIFGDTPDMIKFFSELTGVHYPWDKYHQIVVRDYVSGAMENTGAVIFGDFVYKNKRELLDANDNSTIAHELFHHWFGDLVTCESWSNLPLNESFANYSQYLWDEHRYGLDQADYYADQEADGYYQSAQMQGYHDLIWFDFDDKEEMFDGHSYNKGGRILHMLRNYLGDDAFFAGMKNYLEKNKFKPAEFHQLRLAFEEVSGEDLNWFFNQWFLGSAHPILSFTQEVDAGTASLNITVEQKQNLELSPIYKIPMEIAVFDSKGKHIHKVVVDALTESISIPYEGELEGYIYDYQQAILAKKREKKPREIYIHQYYNGERYLARRDGLKNGAKGTTAESQQLILDALKDSFWGIRIDAIVLTKKLKEEKREEGIAILKDLAANDPESSVRAAALSKLGKLMEPQDVEPMYVTAISNDQSYDVISSALSSLGKENPEKAIALAEPLESEKSSKMLTGIAQLYSGYAGPEKYAFFENALNGNTLQGYDKLGVIGAYTGYVAQQDYEVFEKSYDMYQSLYENGGMYTQMFMPQFIGYIKKSCGDNIEDLEKELAAYEENNDAAYANQTRQKIAKFEALKLKFETFEGELLEKKESSEH
ncbi:MAG: M1 family aminopeptidase [Crocinitomicaceae bacterium]|nr:M1 family aminopeptidase [Crocinitomicaceae bacterium]